MANKIIEMAEIAAHKKFLGNKTLNLAKCIEWGLNVPPFVALPSYIALELFNDDEFRKEIAEQAHLVLNKKKYAVRSSALNEDSETSSFAGQFLTRTKVNAQDLEKAISELLEQADVFLGGDLEKFSIIIQEFIEPEISGIAFSRNPNGGREMVIEYGFCEGEKIVSGAIKPEQTAFYWNSPSLPDELEKTECIDVFKNIEKRAGLPQDIEWCVKDGQFYILQTRPITTITKKQYEEILFLDKILPKTGDFFYEKTEISEIAPRPANLTLDLLSNIYAKNGPVSRVYAKHGVKFNPTEFLKIIGNELYVDREAEIAGLLPAYSYFCDPAFKPKFCQLSKIFSTASNLLALNRLKTGDFESLFSQLKTKIEEPLGKTDFSGTLKRFFNNYELVFETNLLSGVAIKKLELFLKNELVKYAEIIDSASLFVDMHKYRVKAPEKLKGNSLDLADEADFVAEEKISKKMNEDVRRWWKKLPEYKRKMLAPKIAEAVIYLRLRELGRWLTVRGVNELRQSALFLAVENKFKENENIFFAPIKDLLKGAINEAECLKNKSDYEEGNAFSFSNRLTSRLLKKDENLMGVSAGQAEGTLVSVESLDSIKGKKILYTEMLSPDLTKYFPQISGIVSSNGGALSHLAIMARENSIPLIVGFSLESGKIKIGDNVRIDGGAGTIIKN